MEGDLSTACKKPKLSDADVEHGLEPVSDVNHVNNKNNSQATNDFDLDNERHLEKAVEKIDCFQSKIEDVNAQTTEEIHQVQQKYSKIKRTHYDERNKVIRNEIPHFWKTAFIHHPQIVDILTKEDKDCLEYLTDVTVEEFEDIRAGYYLHFIFSSNPYFTNSKLTKEFQLMDTDKLVLEEPISKSTKIDWKDGMNLLKKDKKKDLLPSSFFSWFEDNEEPSLDEIAEILKDDLWPNPLQYYLAHNEEHEVSDYEDNYSDEDDYHDDESVVIVDDDDDDDEEPYDVDKDEDKSSAESDKIEVSSEDENEKNGYESGT